MTGRGMVHGAIDEAGVMPGGTSPAGAVVVEREAIQVTRLRTASVYLFASLFFLALMSGHIYARDEETLYQMTDGLARHGEPLVSPLVWGIVDSSAPSKHGLRPTSYAPAQPVAALPLYWLGRAASGAADPRYAAYLGRFVTLSFNAFVTAATTTLLFRFALALGYRARAGVLLAICYGASTFALIQARTFFAEPLTACLVLFGFLLLRLAAASAAMDRRQWLLLGGSGFVSALALLVKIHAALFVPVLALYLVLTSLHSLGSLRQRSSWRALVWRGTCWAVGLIVPVATLLLYNRWLYGSPLTTGYGEGTQNIFTTPLGTGLHGLLYSSGKGIIWFAPPIVFAIIGFPHFARRFAPEAVAILAAALLNILFYARLEYWHGDGSWGPRYLLILLPWLLLPALPVLDRLLAPGWDALRTVARVGAAALLVAGFSVQLLAIAVSFDVPLLKTPNDSARWFSRSQSPIVTSYHTARARFSTWWAYRHPAANTFRLGGGLYPPENNPTAHFPRWTSEEAVVALNPRGGATLRVKLTYFDHRPAPLRQTATPVTVALGAQSLTPAERLPIAERNEGFILAYDLSPALLRSVGHRLTIRAPTWNPAAAGASDRDENLGIFINNLEIWADGVPMVAEETKVFPPVPETPRQVWVWANYPEYPHLLDWWPVLLDDADLPRSLTAGIAAGMLGCLTAHAGGGVLCVTLARRAHRHGVPAVPLTEAGERTT